MPALSADTDRATISWGRAGVDLATYRQDAIDCASMAYYADVSGTAQAQLFKQASKRLQALDDSSLETGSEMAPDMNKVVDQANRQERVRSSIRPEKLMRELESDLQDVVTTCLQDRGYTRFRLTAEQDRYLATLKRGSDERRAYLHSLASHPTVMDVQGVNDAES